MDGGVRRRGVDRQRKSDACGEKGGESKGRESLDVRVQAKQRWK